MVFFNRKIRISVKKPGTPQKIVNNSGQVVWAAAYLPFGKAQVKPETVTNNLRFPGQYFDAESGLHYNRNRYYDPETGRYITADPIGLSGGINLYAYVMGNPVNLSDMDGLHPVGEGWSYNESSGLWESSPSIIFLIKVVASTHHLSPLDFYEAIVIAMFPMEGVVAIIAGEGTRCATKISGKSINEIAKKIAKGHAGGKHNPRIKVEELAELIKEAIERGKNMMRKLKDGREAYYDDLTGRVVIIDPKHPDGGTSFIPKNGRGYFDSTLQ